jgi:hypothetical protein
MLYAANDHDRRLTPADWGHTSSSTFVGRCRAVPSCCTDGSRGSGSLMEGQAGRAQVQPWRRALLVMIVISLLCAPVSWIDDGITPSWVLYPIALLIALWRFQSGQGALFVAIAALVFLIVHLPWSWAAITGAENNPLDRKSPSSPLQWLITLSVVPLLTSAIGWITWFKQRSTRAGLGQTTTRRPTSA